MFSYAGILPAARRDHDQCGDLLPDEWKKLTESQLVEVNNCNRDCSGDSPNTGGCGAKPMKFSFYEL